MMETNDPSLNVFRWINPPILPLPTLEYSNEGGNGVPDSCWRSCPDGSGEKDVTSSVRQLRFGWW